MKYACTCKWTFNQWGFHGDSTSDISEQASEVIVGSVIAGTILVSVGYAIVRYPIAGDVPWDELSNQAQ